MLVSVLVITYNHAQFIARTVDAILQQKANFQFKIIISDDCSKDGTQEILKEYEKRYSDKIKLLLNENNIGMMPNFSQALENCNGNFVALCDGDDYWTDENKLQKQVDFLEANSNYAISFHAVNVLDNGIERPSVLNRSAKEETYSILDLAEMNIMQTPSVVFRNKLFENFPDWFNESPIGDYVLHMLNAKKGLIKYFPEVMAIYRLHPGGVWGLQHEVISYQKFLWVLNKLKKEDFNEDVIKRITKQKNRVFNEYIDLLLHSSEYGLLKSSYQSYYQADETPDMQFIINLLTAEINRLNNDMMAIKNKKSYRFATRLSVLKYKYSKLFDKRAK